MALQNTGAISLVDIQVEFNGLNDNIAILDYYRGGVYVPDTAANSSIPTTGEIRWTNFYGGDNTPPPPSTTYYQFTPIYSTDVNQICSATRTRTVYQANTGTVINFSDPIYTTSAATNTAAAGYYNNNDASQPAYDYWNGSSWANQAAFCFGGI